MTCSTGIILPMRAAPGFWSPASTARRFSITGQDLHVMPEGYGGEAVGMLYCVTGRVPGRSLLMNGQNIIRTGLFGRRQL